jgi:pteridine reductase
LLHDLKGRTALVTGGAKRVGREISLRLAGAGSNVVINWRKSASEAEGTLADLKARGVEARAVQADLTRLDDCDRLIEEARRITGRVDILVNNASEFPRTPLADLDRDRALFERAFEQLVAIHMKAPLYLGLKLGLRMKESGWGRIVNLLDRVVVRGQAYGGWLLYLATKYGLYGLNQTLAHELAPEVAVNGIAPGLVIPPDDFSREEVARLLDRIPLKRLVGPEEIAEDVLYLIRSESKTGSVLLSDGGSGLRTF